MTVIKQIEVNDMKVRGFSFIMLMSFILFLLVPLSAEADTNRSAC